MIKDFKGELFFSDNFLISVEDQVMRYILGIFLGLVCFIYSAPLSTSVVDNFQILVGCSLYDFQGNEVIRLRGQSCMPLSDGSYISYKKQKVSKWGPTGELIWTTEQDVHHDQVRVFCNESRVALLTYAIHEYNHKKILFDKIVILDSSTGAILSAFDFYDHLESLQKAAETHNLRFSRFMKVEAKASPFYKYEEFMHGNTVALGEEKNCSTKLPEDLLFTALNFAGTPIIAKIDLQNNKIKFLHLYPADVIHDVQPLPNQTGKLLVYNNAHRNKKGNVTSTYEIFDVEKKRVVDVFDHNDTSFYFLTGGGLNYFSENVIFLKQVDGSVGNVYTKTKQWGWRMRIHEKSLRGLIIKDFTPFLSQHRG